MTQDRDFMQVALDLARLGLGRTSPNPAVGAVIVKKNKIVAMGFHKKAGMPHAEIEAMNTVGALYHSTLYVTLEPCCHYGRTPPCTEAIIQSGIKKVVIGMKDPDPKVSGKGIQILKRAGIKVQVGILEKECQKLNEVYIKHRKTGGPYVTLKAAMTLDGKVGLKNKKPFWITGPKSREQAHVLRDRHDAILVGVNTILSDDPWLTTRLFGKKGKDPIRVVLDSNLRIPLTSKILHLKSKAPTWIATTEKNSPKMQRLKKMGIDILVCRRNAQGQVDLKDFLKQLGQRGILSLLVEGGPEIWKSFLRKNLIDHIILFTAPKLLGPKGLPFLSDRRIQKLIRNLKVRKVGHDLCFEGKI